MDFLKHYHCDFVSFISTRGPVICSKFDRISDDLSCHKSFGSRKGFAQAPLGTGFSWMRSVETWFSLVVGVLLTVNTALLRHGCTHSNGLQQWAGVRASQPMS